jgi:hypothetical protein
MRYTHTTVPRFPEILADKALNPLLSHAFDGTEQ